MTPAPHVLVLPILLAASSLTVMAGATIAPSLPALKDHFAATPDIDLLARLVLTAPGLAIALAAPLAGGVADRFGRLPVLVSGVVLYAASGASGLVLDDIWAILVGRVLLGFAVGMIMTASSALIGDLFAGPGRERVIGLQAAFMNFGGVAFLLGGGLLAEISWRGPFAIYLLPLLLAPLALRFVAEPPVQTRIAAAAAMPWTAVGFIYLIAFIGMIVFYIIPVQLPFLFRALGSTSPTLAGAGIAACSLVSGLTSLILLRHLRTRFGFRALLILSFAAMASGYVAIWLAPSPAFAFLGLTVVGFGIGLQMPNLGSWLQQIAPPQARARVMGGFTMAIFLGQFVSPFVHGPAARLVGYSASFLAAAALAIVGLALLALRREP